MGPIQPLPAQRHGQGLKSTLDPNSCSFRHTLSKPCPPKGEPRVAGALWRCDKVLLPRPLFWGSALDHFAL